MPTKRCEMFDAKTNACRLGETARAKLSEATLQQRFMDRNSAGFHSDPLPMRERFQLMAEADSPDLAMPQRAYDQQPWPPLTCGARAKRATSRTTIQSIQENCSAVQQGRARMVDKLT